VTLMVGARAPHTRWNSLLGDVAVLVSSLVFACVQGIRGSKFSQHSMPSGFVSILIGPFLSFNQ
jgi:drug/metabolite transporter (DMT)-like permease